jgi:hypothetical protein
MTDGGIESAMGVLIMNLKQLKERIEKLLNFQFEWEKDELEGIKVTVETYKPYVNGLTFNTKEEEQLQKEIWKLLGLK